MRQDRRQFPNSQGKTTVESGKEKVLGPHDDAANIGQITEEATETSMMQGEDMPGVIEETITSGENTPDAVEEIVIAEPTVCAAIMQESRDVQLLRYNLEQMADALTTASGIISEANVRRYVEKYNAVCKLLVSKNKPELFDMYLQYHLDHKDTHCNERTALIGTNSLRRPDHDRLILVYHIFRTIALKGDKKTLDPNTVISVFGESPEIMAYISRKLP
jgi:hypothetical protein